VEWNKLRGRVLMLEIGKSRKGRDSRYSTTCFIRRGWSIGSICLVNFWCKYAER